MFVTALLAVLGLLEQRAASCITKAWKQQFFFPDVFSWSFSLKYMLRFQRYLSLGFYYLSFLLPGLHQCSILRCFQCFSCSRSPVGTIAGHTSIFLPSSPLDFLTFIAVMRLLLQFLSLRPPTLYNLMEPGLQ